METSRRTTKYSTLLRDGQIIGGDDDRGFVKMKIGGTPGNCFGNVAALFRRSELRHSSFIRGFGFRHSFVIRISSLSLHALNAHMTNTEGIPKPESPNE
jgi:hypothetical protein